LLDAVDMMRVQENARRRVSGSWRDAHERAHGFKLLLRG
jgi:hypothetical protein